MARNRQFYTLLTEKAATGRSDPLYVRDFRNAIVSTGTSNSGSMTYKFKGAIGESAPDFGSAQSKTNQWDYIEVVDLEDGTHIDGDTGIVLTGTDDMRLFEININSLDWICIEVTAYAAGKLSATAVLTDNY